jgi:3-deoxy-D-manno-octulosonic-acid transferase
MLLYSAALTLGLALSSPWWLLRLATTERYREGLRQRLGAVPYSLEIAVRRFRVGRRVVWVHAVSVGEVLAATRLVAELEAALGALGHDGWRVVVSTTTRTGQALARGRFGAERVFYMPLDFGFAVRAYLRALRPAALILMESELWPRMLHECRRAGVPVAVVNARVSDRSFARGMRVKWLWSRVLRGVTLWLAQSEEDARRLVAMGAAAKSVRPIGNLKYDVRAPERSRVAELIKEAAEGRPIVVAGSTVASTSNATLSEDEMFLQAMWHNDGYFLVLAPRHPERFDEVRTEAIVTALRTVANASEFNDDHAAEKILHNKHVDAVMLDTIGDLAAVYGVADVAFVGGSLVRRGGHNPLEPAQFGVPVVMGPSYENFRGIVGQMLAADAIRIAKDAEELRTTITQLLTHREAAREMGERGRRVFEEQQGATAQAVEAIVGLVSK